jgi:hypothetical protein
MPAFETAFLRADHARRCRTTTTAAAGFHHATAAITIQTGAPLLIKRPLQASTVGAMASAAILRTSAPHSPTLVPAIKLKPSSATFLVDVLTSKTVMEKGQSGNGQNIQGTRRQRDRVDDDGSH